MSIPTSHSPVRRVVTAGLAAALLALGGCAALNPRHPSKSSSSAWKSAGPP